MCVLRMMLPHTLGRGPNKNPRKRITTRTMDEEMKLTN